jgi:methionine synthase II (cobalamin-independent)
MPVLGAYSAASWTGSVIHSALIAIGITPNSKGDPPMIPTEPIGSIPRPVKLLDAINAIGDGYDSRLDPLYDEAVRDTIQQFEATGSPVITDGEQRKYQNFWTYSVHGLPNTARLMVSYYPSRQVMPGGCRG